jgi:hypothetical protein
MLLELTLPPNKTPTLQPYTRDTATAVGLPITGAAVAGRPTLYRFDVSSLDDDDYVMDVANPVGRFVVRLSDPDYFIANEWWEIDILTDPASDPHKVLVDVNYGGTNNLRYDLDGVPIEDATIEVFLYSMYIAGNKDGTYRLRDTRQRANGTWVLPFYLDPGVYVFRYYRSGVAGPDAFRVVVSFDPSEISVTKLPSA